MSFQLTTSLKVKKFGYVEEVTRGVIPASAAFVSLNTENFTPTTTTNVVEQAILGSPFVFARPKTGERYRFALDFSVTDINFLQYCINTSGTKNRDKSLTFGVSQDMNAAGVLVEHYYFAKGAICDSVTVSGTNERVGVSTEWVPLDVTIPATTHGISWQSDLGIAYCTRLDRINRWNRTNYLERCTAAGTWLLNHSKQRRRRGSTDGKSITRL